MDIKQIKIGIISLGLIGGSIFKALKKHHFEIVCFSTNEKTSNTLRKEGFEVSNDLNIVKDCNVIFVCSPMRNVLDILDKLENIVDKNSGLNLR